MGSGPVDQVVEFVDASSQDFFWLMRFKRIDGGVARASRQLGIEASAARRASPRRALVVAVVDRTK